MTAARLFLHRFRRPIAAACAALAALLAFAAARPGAPAQTQVVVVAHDLPAGARLTSDDIEIRDVPIDFAAPGALDDPGDAVGRTVSTEITAGETLTPSRLVATDMNEDGLHLVPVRLADPDAADLLAPGGLIDLVAVEPSQTPRVLAAGVRVITVPRPAGSSGWGTADRRAGSLIVVAADRPTAVMLAAVGAQPGLGVVMR